MDFEQITVDRFSELCDNMSRIQLSTLSFIDRAIWEITSFRCSSDMGGHLDPFEQFYEDEAQFDIFISILDQLGETYLTNQFIEVKSILKNMNFWNRRHERDEEDDCIIFSEEDYPELFSILVEISDNELLWKLDEKLGKIYAKEHNLLQE